MSKVPKVIGRVSAIAAALSILYVPTLNAEGLTLEEVVVTAQKRSESVQDVPATVNVVSGEALQEFSVFNFSDVEQLTAGMTLDTSRRQGIVSLRGLSFDPDSAARAAVETYWNEAVVRSGVMFQQVYDVERLEVLRGPQGTLQGRTSPGGAIMMVTRRPSYDAMEGMIQTTFSDNDGFNTQFGVSMPLIENELAVRVSGVYDESDAGEFENITLGKDLSERSRGGRFSMGWKPGDSFDTTFIYEYMNAEADSHRPIAGSDIRDNPLTPPTPTLDTFDRKEITEALAFSGAENNIYGLLMNWELGPVRLSSVTNYQDTKRDTFEDLDFVGALPGVTPAQATTDGEIFIQELRIAGTDTEFWDWLFGFYFQDQETDTVVIAVSTL
jgi:outer membrane receptor protein involved in Fe transport